MAFFKKLEPVRDKLDGFVRKLCSEEASMMQRGFLKDIVSKSIRKRIKEFVKNEVER